MIPSVFFLLLFAILGARAATPADWRNRIIYQIMTDRFARTDGSTTAPCDPSDEAYCGGSWQGITNHLDYIKDMGFTAIWISPITMQIGDSNTYHGYDQSNLYKVNSHFGTASDLQTLSSEIHSRGMYLMVDIVVNHFGSTTIGQGNWSSYVPFNSESYFHPYCLITQDDYDNDDMTALQDCWVGNNLPDVNTTQTTVRNDYSTWITQLVSNYSVDGFRIDSVQNVEPDFFPDFSSAAGVYCVGEVLNSQSSYVCPYQDYLDGIINYPLYFSLISAFESTSGSMTDLASVYTTLKSSCADTTLMAPFLENHDRPRFPYYTSDTSLIRNAILTTLMSDGPPIIYEGQEYGLSSSGDPYNREAIWLQSGAYSTTGTYHGFIALVNLIRNQLIMATSSDSSWSVYKSEIIYSDSHTIALRKGSAGTQSVTLITNQGSDGSAYDVTLTTSETGWDVDEDIVEAISCDTGTTNSGGGFVVSVESEPQIWLGSSLLSGTGLCGL